MYMKVEYASWLKATYGFNESIRELVPILKVPPLFELEPGAPDANSVTAPTARPRTRIANDRFFMSPSSLTSRSERRFVHREGSAIGVERTTNAERKCSEVLPVAERKLVEHGNAQRLEVLLEHVFERARACPVGSFPLVAPVAVLHLSDDHSGDSLELAGGGELRQEAVDVVRRRLHVLEEQDRVVGLELPRRAHRLHQEPQAAADERCRDLPAVQRADIRVVGIPRDLARAVARQHVDESFAREARPVFVADSDEAVAVQRGEASRLADRNVQGGDVGIPDERLGVRADDIEVEVRNRLGRAEAALQALHDIDLGVREESGEVGRAAARVAGDVVVTIEDAVGELDVVTLRLPPLDAAQNLRARVVRARRRGDSDRPAGRQRTTEERGLTHEGRCSFRTGGKGKILPDAASAMRPRRRSSSPFEASRCLATCSSSQGPGGRAPCSPRSEASSSQRSGPTSGSPSAAQVARGASRPRRASSMRKASCPRSAQSQLRPTRASDLAASPVCSARRCSSASSRRATSAAVCSCG